MLCSGSDSEIVRLVVWGNPKHKFGGPKGPAKAACSNFRTL